jgi:rubrerythrin
VPDVPDDNPARVPIVSSAVCLGCGYPLNGLDPASNCPECGKPVALSRPSPDLSVYPEALPPVDGAAAAAVAAALEPLPRVDGMWPCARCGYGLHNQKLDAFCPSCGYPVAASVPDRAGYQTPRGTKCRMCAYALETLDRRGRCPECNFEIERSLRGDLLLDSPPEHIARLRIGALLILWSAALPIITAAMLIASIIYAIGTNGWSEAAGWMMAGMMLCAYIAFFAGWVLFTDRDAGSFTPGIESMRLATRIAVLVSGTIIGFFIMYASGVGLYRGYGPYSGVLDAVVSVGYLGGLATSFTAMILSMIYLRRWSQRLPDTFIFRRARLMMWAWPGLVVLFFLVLILQALFLFSLRSMGVGFVFGASIYLVYPLGLLVVAIFYIHLFVRVRRALGRVQEAQRNAAASATRTPDHADQRVVGW